MTSADVRVPLMSLFGLESVTVTAAATAIFDHPLSATGLAVAADAENYPEETWLYGLRWLHPDAGSGCWATVTAYGWTQGEPDFECSPQYLRDYVYDKDVLIPLYSGPPHNNEYRIAGFAYFHVTGYDFGNEHTYPSSGFSCNPSDPDDPDPWPWQPCLRGYFTPSRTIYSGTPGGPGGYGLVLVKLTG